MSGREPFDIIEYNGGGGGVERGAWSQKEKTTDLQHDVSNVIYCKEIKTTPGKNDHQPSLT